MAFAWQPGTRVWWQYLLDVPKKDKVAQLRSQLVKGEQVVRLYWLLPTVRLEQAGSCLFIQAPQPKQVAAYV
jgi:hypothetical protein